MMLNSAINYPGLELDSDQQNDNDTNDASMNHDRYHSSARSIEEDKRPIQPQRQVTPTLPIKKTVPMADDIDETKKTFHHHHDDDNDDGSSTDVKATTTTADVDVASSSTSPTSSVEEYYGYGDGAPDVAKQYHQDSNNNNRVDATTSVSIDLYGYGDGAPDVATNNNSVSNSHSNNDTCTATTTTTTTTVEQAADLYGYGDATPDVAQRNTIHSNNIYNYGAQQTAQPALASNGGFIRCATHTYDGTRVPRRSSLKMTSSYHGTNEYNDRHQQQIGTEPNTCRNRMSRRNSSIEVRLRGIDQPIQRRVSIGFENTVHVKEVESMKDLADSISELWLQADDFAEMKEHRRNLLKKYKEQKQEDKRGSSGNNNNLSDKYNRGMRAAPRLADTTNANNNSDNTEICHTEEDNNDDSFRGLERYIDKSGRRQKNMAWDTVLLEQDEQECSGYFDEHRIAELYKYTTQESPEKALERAKQDRLDVEEYLMSPRTTKLLAQTKYKALRRVSC